MNDAQKNELQRHFNTINDEGESLIKGTLPWLILEALENVQRLNDILDQKDRASKKDLRIVLKDLRDQLREIRCRIS